MEKTKHIQALKRNMEGTIAQYEARIAYEKTKLEDMDDEEEKAKQEMQIDAYQEKLEEVKEDYEPFIEFIEDEYEEE